jgi:hypothetical protein
MRQILSSDQPFLRGTELTYFYTARAHDIFSLRIHAIRNIINDFLDANLNNLDATRQTRTSNPLASSQKNHTYYNKESLPFPHVPSPPPTTHFPISSECSVVGGTSACIHKQLDNDCPLPSPMLHLEHPPSLQFCIPLGVPLYPVLITRPLRTRTHPTRRFIQLLRRAAKSARCIK